MSCCRIFIFHFLQVFKPDNIYGGLLKDRVRNKTCKKEDGKYLIPDVPKEVQYCVQKTKIDKESKQELENLEYIPYGKRSSKFNSDTCTQ